MTKKPGLPEFTQVVLRCEAIDQDSVQLFPEAQDAAVSIKLGANRIEEALVPLHVVDQKHRTVMATIINHGRTTVLSFAPTTFGVERYTVDIDELAGIIVSEATPTGG